MLNVTAVGNVAFDPEQKQVGDFKVTSFKLLVNKKIKDEEITTAIKCSVWGNRGDVVMLYVNKGMKLTVSGSAYVRAFLRKDETPAGELELRVDDFSLPQKPKAEDLASEKPF
tara:strand:- start:187 stop:525 length:339 start_codon:yes stop_codon:yes gene_type:complete